MRRRLGLWGFVLLAALGAAACKDEGEKAPSHGQQAEGAKGEKGKGKILFYRSPMNPNFISKKPGKDAMGMDLIPVREGSPEADLSSLKVQGATLQRMGVRIEPVRRQTLTRTIRAVGHVELDETRITKVNMKFDGWIEKLYADQTGEYVKKGEPLFAVYSPELVASEQEYLQILQGTGTGPHAAHLLRSARERLEQFDVPRSFIRRLEKTGQPQRRIVIYAPASGYIISKTAFEGTYVKEGTNLYSLGELDALWVIADVYEFDAPWVAVGQDATVEMTYLPGQLQEARVDFVYPTLDETSRTLRVRLTIPNPKVELLPGMFATVRIHAEPVGKALVVPDEAVIHSGERNVAFVSLGDGRFEPRDLKLGVWGNEGYQVLDGLEEGDPVVVSGQFLLDSESRLKEAILDFLGGNLEEGGKSPSKTGSESKASSEAGGGTKSQGGSEPEGETGDAGTNH